MTVPLPFSPTMIGLAPHIHVARTPSSTILLNVAADRYLRLPEHEAEAINRLLREETIVINDPALRSLRQRGVVVEGGRALRLPHLPRIACSALESSATSQLRPEGLWPLITWRWRWRTRTFAALLRNVAQVNRSTPSISIDRAEDLARRFARARLLAPLKRRCLPDAAALMTLCHRHDIDARFVIGVRDHPFAAHAWVIVADMVVSDPLDVVRELVPIYVS